MSSRAPASPALRRSSITANMRRSILRRNSFSSPTGSSRRAFISWVTVAIGVVEIRSRRSSSIRMAVSAGVIADGSGSPKIPAMITSSVIC